MVGTHRSAAAARVAGVILCLMVSSFGVSASGVTLKSCGLLTRSLETCLAKAMQDNIQALANGDSQNQVPAYDPLIYTTSGGTTNNGQTLSMSGCSLSGYKKVVISNLKITIKGNGVPTRITQQEFIPKLQLKCQYSMQQDFLAGEPSNQGTVTIEIDNFSTVIDYQLDSTAVNSNTYSKLHDIAVGKRTFSNFSASFTGLGHQQLVRDSNTQRNLVDFVVWVLKNGKKQVTSATLDAFPPVSTWIPRGLKGEIAFSLKKRS